MNNEIVAPLPTIAKHIRERGFDHTALLAKKVAKVCGGKYSVILVRNNNSVQVGADMETRREQARNAYGVASSVDAN